MLSRKKHWCVDGTFRSVPYLYLQLFSIHALKGDKPIPLIYYLLAAKTRIIYSEVFRALNDKANELNKILSPDLVTCDFERGLITCIRLEFLTACIRGCYFHFCQAVYRKVQVWVYLNFILLKKIIKYIYESFLRWQLYPLNLSLKHFKS